MSGSYSIDLLDFTGEDMYFDRQLSPEVEALIETAAEHYGVGIREPDQLDDDDEAPTTGDAVDVAEFALLRAYLLAPEHLTVLVALYRFFYYRKRLPEALLIAERAVAVASRELGLPEDWRAITGEQLGAAILQSMALTRFLLLALKGSAYLLLRMDAPDDALQRLEKVALFDSNDRLGLGDLLTWARNAATRAEVASQASNVSFIR